MSGSLQDQLLKAGLVTKKKAKQADREKQKNAKIKRETGEFVDEAKVAADKARAAKLEKDRQLNEQQKAEADAKAIRAQIKQLIELNALQMENAEIDYNFVDGNKVKKIQVTEKNQDQLSRGHLAIAKLGDRYYVVPNIVADKISQRDESYIKYRSENNIDVAEEDDPYADYQIPDDLMW